MITLYSGIPGSGKSYKMVHDLDEVKKKDYFSPEEGRDWELACREAGQDVKEFFSKDYQIEFSKGIREKYGKNILVIIDESHEWFDKNHKDLKMWLSYHRHLNQDIWLVAHRSTNLSSVYRSFIEVEYRAKHGSFISIPGFFLYNRILGGEKVGYKFTKKKQEVFNLYKSQDKGFKKQRPSMLLPVVLLICVGAVFYFVTMPKRAIGHGKTGVVKNEAATVAKNERNEALNDDFRYAGFIGGQYLIEDMQNRQIIKISEMPGKIMFVGLDGDNLKLWNIEKRKEIILKTYCPVKAVGFPATQEQGKTTAPQRKIF
jgi:hypothetical protein